MTLILADLPDEDIKWLDQLAAEQGKSRGFSAGGGLGLSAQTAMDGLEAGFGLWALGFERGTELKSTRMNMTASVVRNGIVVASPDMFNEYDNRQRQIYVDMVAGRYSDVKMNEESGK